MVTTTTTTTRTQVISTCEDDDALISTPSGMVRVSPYIKNGHAEFRSALSFVPRYSSFDRENVKSQNDQFRGFFTLFWIGELSSVPNASTTAPMKSMLTDFLFAAALTSLSITVASRLATTMRDCDLRPRVFPPLLRLCAPHRTHPLSPRSHVRPHVDGVVES